MKLQYSAPPALLGLLLTAGCASNALYFGTETSSGVKISGAQTAPTNVALAYQRAEVALIPPKSDGTTHAVFGGLDHDYSWREGFLLAQTFATGEAAVIAAKGQRTPGTGSGGTNQTRKLFFTTGTTFGFDLNFGQDLGTTVPSLVVGYRRAEATVIPIDKADQEVNSVYADISIAHDNNGSLAKNIGDAVGKSRTTADIGRLPASGSGVRIRQTFATGQAALAVAGRTDAQAKLREAAGLGSTYQDALRVTRLRDDVIAKLNTITDETKRNAIRTEGNTIARAADIAEATDWSGVTVLVDTFTEDQIKQLQASFPELK